MRRASSLVEAQSIFKPYLVAVLITALAISIRYNLNGTVGPGNFPVMFLGVALSAAYGGFWPGIVAALISALSNLYFFITPINSFAIEDSAGAVNLLLFSCGSFVVATLTSTLHDARRRTQELAAQKAAFMEKIFRDFRRPIRLILGSSELIRKTTLIAEQLNLSQTIEQAGEELLEILNHSIEFEQLEVPVDSNVTIVSLPGSNRKNSEANNLRSIFLELMPSRLQVIDEAISTSDLVTVSRVVSLCRTGAGALGLVTLLKICDELEIATQNSSTTALTALHLQMKREYDRILNESQQSAA